VACGAAGHSAMEACAGMVSGGLDHRPVTPL